MNKETRPVTQPMPVADGWAGAEMRVFAPSNSIITLNGQTDERTDGQTDKVCYTVASPRLKNEQRN